ncbi:MAG: mechanosensitive ion channel family protein [Cellulosilyticaceae bacterium]
MLNNLLHSFPSYAFFIQLGSALIVFLIFLLLRKLVHNGIFNFFKRKQHLLTDILDEMTSSLERPLDYLWVLTGGYLAIMISPFVNYPTFKQPLLIIGEIELSLHFIPFDFLNKGYATLFIIGLTWAAYNFVDIYEKLLLRIGSKFTLFDNALIIRFTAKIIKFIVMVIGIGIIISQFIELGNILTGVGIAGAAFTFIAKDTLTDIMSGVVLMVDTPFTIGDWVAIGSLEGIVEDVSFRSTRIRTFEQGLVVIPNATLANDNILNWSTMPKRRYRFSLGITYDTPKETLTTFIEALKNELHSLEAIESDSLLVFFDNYGDFSLNIMVQYFTTNTDLKSYSALKEQVNLIIMDLAHTHQVTIAFPTQTIHLQND